MRRLALNAPQLGCLLLVIAVAGCSPAGPASVQGDQSMSQAPAARKVLTIAARQELLSFADFTGLGSAGGGNAMIRHIAHDYLASANDEGVYVAQLATETPSVQRGTWTVNPDGSMETTWKLRPGIRWQDGQPFSVDDILFAYALHSDPDFTLSTPGRKGPA